MRFLFILTLICTSFITFSQETTPKVPRFSKHKIGTSNCSAYFPIENPTFDESKSADSSNVITFETLVENHYFGIIHVDLHEEILDSMLREELLVNYLDFLQDNFSIIGSAGYGKGHFLEKYPQAQGIIDYWEDVEGTNYAVKAWITPKYVTIFMIYGTGDYPIFNVKEMFFNGVRYD